MVDIGFQALGCDDIDFSPEGCLEGIGQFDEFQADWSVELHKDIHIAVFARVSPGKRAEDGYPLNPKFFSQGGKLFF